MVRKSLVLGLSTVFLVIFALFLQVSFVSAEDYATCWQYSNSNNSAACTDVVGCSWVDASEDMCFESGGCCMDTNCGIWEGTSQAICEANDASLTCEWEAGNFSWTSWEDGVSTTHTSNGTCYSNSFEDWGGYDEGCWNYDGNQNSCTSQGSSCSWSQNDQNQDPWCYVKTLSDAQNKNPDATTTDIGCCSTASCWQYDNNEASCSTSFNGTCYYENNTYGGGWCSVKPASELLEAQCNYTKQNLFMPYNWDPVTNCTDGGFSSFEGDSDSCFSSGGWYNSTGGCVMPSGDGFGGGGGGFMFAGDSKCWFADNQQQVCGNVTGCAYCVNGNVPNGVGNVSSICSGKQIDFCEGHDTSDVNTYPDANNTASIACTDINVKTACNYGPLPNCNWANSSATVGAYCEVGGSTGKKTAPPAQYCEDPIAKNNYTICTQLSNDFMMPCKWQNETYPITNCTFNSNAVFGGSGGEMDFEVIGSQFSCTSAGGTWQTEYYVDGEILKQDSWCEMTGMFNVDQGQGTNNKVNCDTSCWACEFQNNGTAWGNVAVAEAACVGSGLEQCSWTNDTSNSSFSNLGWCDFPKEMENGGSKDCTSECEGCNFMNSPQTACEGSQANDGEGCKWVNDTTNMANGGFCVDKSKKTCDSDCSSCYDFTSCTDNNTALDCTWDQTFNLCKANGFTGEICFNGVDDDSDSLVDCSDPDCGFDNFCGGSSFGGDCFAQTAEGTCNVTNAFVIDGTMANCTWVNSTWNPEGWCDMPGSNCWTLDSDLVTCGDTIGCTNDTTSMGSDAWCEMNMTQMDDAACWGANNESGCSALPGNCAWKNNTWSGEGAVAGSGWCDYAPFSTCMDLDSSSCSTNANCSWQEDNYSMDGGWCNAVCMNWDLNQTSCEEATLNGLCEWRDMSATCQPSTFMMMGTPGTGGKTGCWQYDGNETGCGLNSVTCTYKNDTYSNNNLSATEPSGWCMDKSEYEHFGDMEGDVIDLAMDGDNIMGLAESGVDKEVDLMGIGMRVTDAGFDFGAGILNVSETMMCNGYGVGNPENFLAPKIPGSGNKTTKFYWYLDTNGNTTDGCVAVQNSTTNLTGYEFMVSYISRNTTSGTVETKQLMRCSSGVWSPTNAQVTTSKMLSCGEIGGVMIAIAKQDLESFSEYNKTTNLKIFMASANDTHTRLSPSDSVGPGYYTPGTVDFGFVDCSNPANAKDSKCKNFQKFGFNVYEECKNGVDDDENGLIDELDPFCAFMPDGSGNGGFSFVVDSNDNTAPTIMFSQVEKLWDAAFLKMDTNEPSNLTLSFYKNDSTCKTLNTTVDDTGIGGVGNEYQANANFKPFHSVDLMTDTLGYALTNNTAYYYKIKVCDPSNNCAVSACSNFTTKTTNVDKTFIFKIELPATGNYSVDIPAMNKTNYNFTENFGGVDYEVGIKTNTSVTQNMNMTIHCGDMAIGFFGMNILSPTKIDLSAAFVCDSVNNLMGMNSSSKKWNKLINDLHLGGAADYIEITIPVAYSADNNLNWTDDSGADGQDVDDYVECRDGGNSNTICKVPVSMGFSAYTVSTPAVAAPGDSGDGGTGGGGGGGGGADTNTTANDTTSVPITGDVVAGDDGDDDEDSSLGDSVAGVFSDLKEGSWKTWALVGGILILIIVGIVWFVIYKKRKI
jgi:hypothetical protein